MNNLFCWGCYQVGEAIHVGDQLTLADDLKSASFIPEYVCSSCGIFVDLEDAGLEVKSYGEIIFPL